MYIVVSRWEALPGHETEWRAVAEKIGASLRAVPGVDVLHRFANDEGQLVVVMGYSDEATYHALVHDANGAVVRVMADADIESVARWISSERGVSVE